MKQLPRFLRPVWASLLLTAGAASFAQKPAVRLSGPITDAARTTLAGSHPPLAREANDIGALPGNTAINGMTLVLSRSAAQDADLTALLAAQANPTSPQFHQWLTPEQFGARFGVADADLSQIEAWLTAEGFTALSVSPSRNRINFSGTAAQANAAFGAEMHQYRSSSTDATAKPNYAPSGDLTLPAAVAPLVTSVDHLSTFRPKPRISQLKPQFTSSVSGNHYLAPGDIATQYNMTSVYNSGFNGAGQTIAVAGQSYIQLSDIANFQSASGLTNNPPTLFLMPGTGASAVYSGDEGESDLDTEWSGGIARGAQILFVYTGDSPNYGVFDAATYVVEHDLAPIITISYGGCEVGYSATSLSQFNTMAMQATSQGQTILTSSGDGGSTTCFGDSTDYTLAQQETPSVDVIADLPNVTGVGGVQMQAGTFTAGNNTYFSAATGSDNVSSLLSYVPETIWNEDSNLGLSSGGGGTSTIVPRPSWQTGVPGIPAGSFRLVPDVSIQASTASPGYLFCSSDTSTWGSGQVGSCTTGFRDSGTLLTVAGGTSFSSPIFAGMLAVLSQAKHETSQGNINLVLYGLASNPTTYASAFHDITTGTNACPITDTAVCSTAGAAGYAAGIGYDEASGLGTINFANLVAAWPASSGTALAASSTTLTAATLTPTSGATDLIAIAVSAASGTPTGSVAISVDGSAPVSVALNNGTATFTYPGTTVGGSHLVSATYSGDGTYASSVGSITLTLSGTLLPTGSFSLAATPFTAPTGGTGQTTIVLTPAGGYTGSVDFAITAGLPSNTCWSINPVVNTTTTVPIPTYTLTFGSGATTCAQSIFQNGFHGTAITKAPTAAASNSHPVTPWNAERTGTLIAGLLGLGFLTRRRSRSLPHLLGMALLTLVVGLGLSGCGGSSTNSVTTPTAPTTTGNFTLTLVGTDSASPSITSSTSVVLTIN